MIRRAYRALLAAEPEALDVRSQEEVAIVEEEEEEEEEEEAPIVDEKEEEEAEEVNVDITTNTHTRTDASVSKKDDMRRRVEVRGRALLALMQAGERFEEVWAACVTANIMDDLFLDVLDRRKAVAEGTRETQGTNIPDSGGSRSTSGKKNPRTLQSSAPVPVPVPVPMSAEDRDLVEGLSLLRDRVVAHIERLAAGPALRLLDDLLAIMMSDEDHHHDHDGDLAGDISPERTNPNPNPRTNAEAVREAVRIRLRQAVLGPISAGKGPTDLMAMSALLAQGGDHKDELDLVEMERVNLSAFVEETRMLLEETRSRWEEEEALYHRLLRKAEASASSSASPASMTSTAMSQRALAPFGRKLAEQRQVLENVVVILGMAQQMVVEERRRLAGG